MSPKESGPQFLDRTNLEEFRRKTLLFGGLTLGGLVIWLVAAPSLSPKAMLPMVRGVSSETMKVPSGRSMTEKSAVLPAPSATTPPLQLAGSLQSPAVVNPGQVPLAA